MKTNKIKFLVALVAFVPILASCSESINFIDEALTASSSEKSIESALLPGDSCTFSGTLSESDINGLMEMREEEKLARDVYSYLYNLHNYVVFRNISKSESAHTSAVLNLINGYGLDDPTPEGEGVFKSEIFTEMYSSLISVGTESLIEALKVGALIEETDINDLEELLEVTENEDIIRVYNHLLSASKIHMKAFTNALVRLGESYTPIIISAEYYEEIIGETNSEEVVAPSVTPGVCDGTGPNS